MKGLGVQTVLIIDDFDARHIGADDAPGLCLRVSSFDALDELHGVAAEIRTRGIRIDHILSPTEFTQYAAGVLSQLLGTPDPGPEMMLRSRDKRIMKARLAAARVPAAEFVSVPHARASDFLQEVSEKIGFPCVVKPVSGFGTCSTRRVATASALSSTLDELESSPHPALKTRRFMVEEFVAGDEFRVDAIWRDSKPLFFLVGRYFSPCLEMQGAGILNGYLFLHQRDHRALYAQFMRFSMRVNRALGIREGVTHLECFRPREGGGLVFSEVATRYGGGVTDLAIESMFGMGMRELWVRTLIGRSRTPSRLTGVPISVGVVAIRPRFSGILGTLPTPLELGRLPGVLQARVMYRAGERVDPADPMSTCVRLVIGADSERRLLRRAAELTQSIEIPIIPRNPAC